MTTTSDIKPDLLTTVLKLITTTGPNHEAEVLVGKVQVLVTTSYLKAVTTTGAEVLVTTIYLKAVTTTGAEVLVTTSYLKAVTTTGAEVLVTTSYLKPEVLTKILKLLTTTGPDHEAKVLVTTRELEIMTAGPFGMVS